MNTHKPWNIIFDPKAEKTLRKLPHPIQEQIIHFLYGRVLHQNDPSVLASPMSGDLQGFWRYRIGDYRVMCTFSHRTLTTLILTTHVLTTPAMTIHAIHSGDRRDVYEHMKRQLR